MHVQASPSAEHAAGAERASPAPSGARSALPPGEADGGRAVGVRVPRVRAPKGYVSLGRPTCEARSVAL